MSRVIAIHQPNFLPWLGFFDKIARADAFVLLDQVQFIRRSWISRVAIREGDKAAWITVPVVHASHPDGPIDTIRIAPDFRADRMWTRLQHAYGRTPHWSSHVVPVLAPLRDSHETLLSLNRALLFSAMDALGLDRGKLRWQSELSASGAKSELMASLTCAADGTVYLSGGHPPSGDDEAGTAADYNDPAEYVRQGVELRYQCFQHPTWDQGGDGFVSGLSVLDALAHLGEGAKGLLGGS
jgi:hypothetical protein